MCNIFDYEWNWIADMSHVVYAVHVLHAVHAVHTVHAVHDAYAVGYTRLHAVYSVYVTQ